MPLMRYIRYIQGYTTTLPNRPVSPEIDISQIIYVGMYIEVDTATTIKIQIEGYSEWRDYDSIVFAAAGSEFVNMWCAPYTKMRLLSTAAAEVLSEITLKT